MRRLRFGRLILGILGIMFGYVFLCRKNRPEEKVQADSALHGTPAAPEKVKTATAKPAPVEEKPAPAKPAPVEEKVVPAKKAPSASKTEMFNHPKKVSARWDNDALKKVETWLSKEISRIVTGESVEIAKLARDSRKVAHISERGNADGIRFLLAELCEKGVIGPSDKAHVVVLVKKPE